MAVTEQELRDYLNGITIEELPSATALQKIADAELVVGNFADPEATPQEIDYAVKTWAGYKAFAVSKKYSSARMGDLTAKREVELELKDLEKTAENALAFIAGAADFQIVSGTMNDDRPLTEDNVERGLFDGNDN